MLCHAHHTFQSWESCGDVYSHKQKSSRDRKRLQESNSERKRIFTEFGEGGISLNNKQKKEFKENRKLYLNSLKRNITRDFFSRSKGIRYCLKRMERNQANQACESSQ